eukprot:m.160302 g.160302  ORF g.160302 m.160302 type:complete len:89 (-) comp14347_c2_seq2:47-313(-)
MVSESHIMTRSSSFIVVVEKQPSQGLFNLLFQSICFLNQISVLTQLLRNATTETRSGCAGGACSALSWLLSSLLFVPLWRRCVCTDCS